MTKGASKICGDEIERPGRMFGETFDAQVIVQKYRRHLNAVE